VSIPATDRLNGEGDSVRTASRGDLYFEIRVREHAIFEREEVPSVSCDVPVSFSPLRALGGSVKCRRSMRSRLKIHAETQSGRVFRVREGREAGARWSRRDLFFAW